MAIWIIVALMTAAPLSGPCPMQPSGATYIWDGDAGDGKWTTSANWRIGRCEDPPNGAYPGFDGVAPTTKDTAVLPSASTDLTLDGALTLGALDLAGSLTISNGALTLSRRDGLKIRSGAELVIGIDGTLQLTGQYGQGSHTIDGDLILATATADLKIAHQTADAYAHLGGSGQLIGDNGGATIVIEEADDLLISGVAIVGELVFTGAGVFDNRGTVAAASGTIFFDSQLVLVDTASEAPRWIADDGTLVLLNDAELWGTFLAGYGGTFSFGVWDSAALVCTEGRLLHVAFGEYDNCYDAQLDGIIAFGDANSGFAWCKSVCGSW